MSMRIKVNGEDLETSESTVMGLLNVLKINKEAVAVEVNLTVIKKNYYSTFRLNDGDTIEIVNFVGGG